MENIENKQKKTFKQTVWGFAKPALIIAGGVTVGILYGGNKFGVKTKVDGAFNAGKRGCSRAWQSMTSRKSTECAGGQCDSAPQQPQYNNNQPRQKWNNNGGGKFNNKA